ncbi:MAG: ABC transporter permease [Dysgonomonas sp.]
MTHHIFKIIWNERKINIWILVELILVFCIIWFCVDYTYFYMKRYFEPKGFNIDHVYNINLGMKQYEEEPNYEETLDDFWTIIDRINKYPGIESSCVSIAAMPYSGSYTDNMFFVDTASTSMQMKSVTSGYFDVFRFKILSGNINNWDNSSENIGVISGNSQNSILKRPVREIKMMSKNDKEDFKIIGTAHPTKRGDFEAYNSIIYTPFDRKDKRIVDWGGAEISIRVKPELEKEFASKFSKNMQEQLSQGLYYLSSVTSMNKQRDNYVKNWGYDNSFKSILSISAFLLLNIFLAVVGTFWFRIQARRGEIGLRIALGSTRTKIKSLFIVETLTLLFLASIIATFVTINISVTDLLQGIGVPSINREKNPIEISQYFADYGFTLLILGIISIIAIWYPASKAAKTQPAAALKDE